MKFQLGDARLYELFSQNEALYLDSGLGEGVSATRLPISGANHESSGAEILAQSYHGGPLLLYEQKGWRCFM